MLTDLAFELNAFVEKSRQYILPWTLAVAILWSFNILNWLTGSRLTILGIIPRHIIGLPGIIFSPFIHQSFNHLFFNSIPLFILGLVILVQGVINFIAISFIIILLGGIGVWIFARPALHIGSSGLVSGYFGYILATAYISPSIITIIAALMVLYYFGGIFLGLFPQEDKVSWESHLFGFISGIGAAWIIPSLLLTFKGK